MAWNDAYNMGSAFPLMDYGSNQLAKYANQNLPNNQNNSGLQWWMNADRSRYPSPLMPGNLDQSGQMGASNYQAPTQDSNTQEYGGIHPENVEGYNFEKTGIMENLKDKLSGFTTPTLEFLKKIGGQRSDAKQAEYDALRNVTDQYGTYRTGTLPGGQYADIVDGKITVTAPDGTTLLQNKNFDSAFGSGSVAEMIQKKEDWSKGQFDKYGDEWTDDEHKGLSTKLYDHYKRTGVLDKWRGTPSQTITEKTITDTVAPGRGQSDRAKIEAYTGRPMSAYRASRPASERQFTGHGRSGMGRDPSDRMAYGGRAGYQEGELVEDEYMAEATPQGMMEENVETVQGEPTREQLEVIALEIFRLPLEELDEKQLMVVYQAAMQQEPSEEEVQFAAQEGPGEGIASLV